MKVRRGITAVAATVAFVANTSVEAQSVESETVLLRMLDRAFKPRFLGTTGARKNADGTYARSVTTGDAIAKPTFTKPFETAEAACAEARGVLMLAMSAGRYTGSFPQTVIQAGEQRLKIDYSSLYSVFADRNTAKFDAGLLGFRPMFRTSPFAEPAAKQADAAPPFGLFQCASSTGAGLWAIAIMPTGMPLGYDLPIRVTPITQDWIKRYHLRAAKRAVDEQQTRIAVDRHQRSEAEHAMSEAVRLGPFRARLKVGSRTNCGIIIAVRDPLVQVQLPPHITGPSGIRDFWVPREELTDAIPPQGCGFGA